MSAKKNCLLILGVVTIFTLFAHAQQRQAVPAGGISITDEKPLAVPHNATGQIIDVMGQPFTRATRIVVDKVDGEQWAVGTGTKNTAPVAKGDLLLAEFAVRCHQSMTGDANCNFVFEEGPEKYTKSIMRPVTVGKEWTYIQLPFKAHRDFAPGEAHIRIWLGYPQQTIEIGDLRVLNYGQKVDPNTLPRTRMTYRGREADAAWRKAADVRIDQLRKADLTVRVVDEQGNPRAGVPVRVKMMRHAYPFGTCVAINALAGKGADSDRYREELTRLFNCIVFENDLKAPQLNARSMPRVKRDLAWLDKNRLPSRGHVLVWPSFHWNKHLVELKDQPEKLRQTIRQHITATVSELKGRLVDWDVMNEPFSNHDFMDILGNEEMIEWFKLAKAADPACNMYINDYGVLEGGPNRNPHLEHYFKTIKYLIDNGAPVDGIGFQAHVGSNLVPPEDLLKVLDKFAVFDKRYKITELDINLNDDEELRADYMRDFLTVCFSHDRVDGILQWGFWSEKHWLPQAGLFDAKWNLRPHGKAYADLVLKTWWTDETHPTDAKGEVRLRGFKGEYEVIVDDKPTPAHLGNQGATVVIR